MAFDQIRNQPGFCSDERYPNVYHIDYIEVKDYFSEFPGDEIIIHASDCVDVFEDPDTLTFVYFAVFTSNDRKSFRRQANFQLGEPGGVSRYPREEEEKIFQKFVSNVKLSIKTLKQFQNYLQNNQFEKALSFLDPKVVITSQGALMEDLDSKTQKIKFLKTYLKDFLTIDITASHFGASNLTDIDIESRRQNGETPWIDFRIDSAAQKITRMGFWYGE